MNTQNCLVIFLLIFLGCKDTKSQSNLDCERKINLEQSIICLPKFENMTECYLNSEIKEFVDFFIPKGSLALGYYLNNETYNDFQRISDETGFDDYLLVFSTDVLSKRKSTRSEFEEFSNFDKQVKTDWNTTKKIITEKIKFLNFDKPVLIENYSINKNVFATVLMSRYQGDENDYINVTISNSIYLKDKIIFTAYYKRYDNVETIRKAKAKNDYFALRFVQDNE